MIVLDADSIVGVRTLVELVRLMQANPDVGMIQPLPYPSRPVLLGWLRPLRWFLSRALPGWVGGFAIVERS